MSRTLRNLAVWSVFVLGVIGMVICAIGLTLYTSEREPNLPLQSIQGLVILVELAGATALLVHMFGFFPRRVRRSGTSFKGVGRISLWLSERPRLLWSSYIATALILNVIGALLFGSTDAAA